MKLPFVTIITPSYNQALFLEETLRSVITQDYPKVEYLVVLNNSDVAQPYLYEFDQIQRLFRVYY